MESKFGIRIQSSSCQLMLLSIDRWNVLLLMCYHHYRGSPNVTLFVIFLAGVSFLLLCRFRFGNKIQFGMCFGVLRKNFCIVKLQLLFQCSKHENLQIRNVLDIATVWMLLNFRFHMAFSIHFIIYEKETLKCPKYDFI